MVRRIGYIRLLLALCLSVLILSPKPAAADPLPGDACPPTQAAHSFQWNSTGTAGGATDAIFCEGGTWKGVMNVQATTGYVGIANTAPGSLLDVGLAGTTLGTLRLEGSTSGYVQLQTNVAAGSWSMTLPVSGGTSGYVLSTNGTGVTSWISNAGTASTALSSITAAAAGHTIANANFAQVWNWDTLTTGTALTIASTSMTNGNLLSLVNTNTTGTGNALYATNASTTNGAAGVYGHSAGASGSVYGVYGDSASASGFGVYGVNSASGGIGIYGVAGTGAAYGVEGATTSTTNGAIGVYGHSTGTSGAVYGVWGDSASASGYGGAFFNSASGGRGVLGQANTGAAIGVFGYTSSTCYSRLCRWRIGHDHRRLRPGGQHD